MIEEAVQITMTVLIVLLAIAPIPSIGATVYLWSLYRSDPGRSWLLRMVAVVGTVTSVSVAYVGFVAIRRLLGFGVLPDPLTIVLGLVLLLLALVPVYMAVRIYRSSHGNPVSRAPGGDEARDVARDEERDPARDIHRDEGRDEGRDPIRDEARDTAHDQEGDTKNGSI